MDKTRKNQYGVLTYKLQQALKALGYSIGSTGVDGKMGPSTESAIRKFQKDTGLAVDGIVGPKTAAKISEKLGAISNSLESYFKGTFQKQSKKSTSKDTVEVADKEGIGKFQEKVKDFFQSYWILVVLGAIAFWSFFTQSGKNFWANFTGSKPKNATKKKGKKKSKKK